MRGDSPRQVHLRSFNIQSRKVQRGSQRAHIRSAKVLPDGWVFPFLIWRTLILFGIVATSLLIHFSGNYPSLQLHAGFSHSEPAQEAAELLWRPFSDDFFFLLLWMGMCANSHSLRQTKTHRERAEEEKIKREEVSQCVFVCLSLWAYGHLIGRKRLFSQGI